MNILALDKVCESLISDFWSFASMKANISNELVERVAKINGKPIVRGMDRAITECLNKLEDGTCADTNEKKEELENKTENSQKIDCLNDGCKEELTQDA